jgi:DNA-binding NarL/FixJ family response regulator
MSFVGHHTNSTDWQQTQRRKKSPLTPALIGLLEAAVTLGTTNNQALAEYLICSGETVKSNFRRLSLLLDTHNRAEAVLIALSKGWIELKRENTPI